MKLEALSFMGDALWSDGERVLIQGHATKDMYQISRSGGQNTVKKAVDGTSSFVAVKDIVPGHPLWAAAYPTARDRRNRE
jgi:hypothetical protein